MHQTRKNRKTRHKQQSTNTFTTNTPHQDTNQPLLDPKNEKIRHHTTAVIVDAAFQQPKTPRSPKTSTNASSSSPKHTQQSAAAAEYKSSNNKKEKQAAQTKTTAHIRHWHGGSLFCRNSENYGKNARRPVNFTAV